MTNEMIGLNTTMSAGVGISSFGSWFGIVALVGIFAIILSLLIVSISSLERYKKLWKFLQTLANSFRYFIWGIGGILVIGIPSLLVYYEASQASQGNIVPFKWTLIPIVAYAIIACIGYIFKKYVVDRIKKFNKEMKK